MPSQLVWFSRLPSIVEELCALDSHYLDRRAIERIFGVRERRARQLMAGLSTIRVGNAVAVSRRSLIAHLELSRADGTAAAELANDPVVPAPRAGDAGGDARATDRSATPAVDRPTRVDDAEAASTVRLSLEQQYEEFCLSKVKDHLRALPEAIRSQIFEQMRSSIRRAVPQLRRNELDEMAQREMESKIRAALRLPSIEEFSAGLV